MELKQNIAAFIPFKLIFPECLKLNSTDNRELWERNIININYIING